MNAAGPQRVSCAVPGSKRKLRTNYNGPIR